MRMVMFFLAMAMVTAGPAFPQRPEHVSIEGHRGARGHLPENTIPSFIRALELGADTLELDVVVSRDRQVVVSHEPWFSHVISLDPQGRRIMPDNEREHNIFLMSYADVRRYDVGSLGNTAFPTQKPLKAYKPLLSEVFAELDQWAKAARRPVPRYNIEIKSAAEGDGRFHPAPDEFARLVYDTVKRSKMAGRVKVQSFDVRPLQAMRRIDPEVKIALLVADLSPIEKHIDRLGFKPFAYSPHFRLVTPQTAEYCRSNDIVLVPWTANELADLRRMKEIGVDAIITDYPERAVEVFRTTSRPK